MGSSGRSWPAAWDASRMFSHSSFIRSQANRFSMAISWANGWEIEAK